MENVKNDKFTEFEVKYRIDPILVQRFKSIISSIKEVKDFKYVEGTDHYLVNDSGFWRFRTEDWTPNGRRELTKKIKPDGAKNNISRAEYNILLDHNVEKEAIFESLKHDGYEYNFSVFKGAHIYFTDDATIVFYTVTDTTPGVKFNEDSFVEIEVDEELIGQITEKEAWEIINKYEKALEPIGITPQKRLRKSLFEMYKK